jgi:uncharacterized membrane protein YkvA (DUF1232 family)
MNERLSPFLDPGLRGSRSSITFPHGFLDFLTVSQGRRHRVGDYTLEPGRLDTFNRALHTLSPEAPGLTLDQIATAAQRALLRHGDGGMPPFVQSRMATLVRLESMVADAPWRSSDECRRQVAVLQEYRSETMDLIPDEQPVVGLLDDALLVDIALQLLRDELGDYEDFSRFRKVAAEFAGMSEQATGLTREHWIEAMVQAHRSLGRIDHPARQRFAPDPQASLFHIG